MPKAKKAPAPSALKIAFAAVPKTYTANSLIITVGADGELGDAAKALDAKTGGQIKTALKANPRFKGGQGETLAIESPHGIKATRLVLLGLGKLEKNTTHDLQLIGAAAYGAVAMKGDAAATLIAEATKGAKLTAENIANIAGGARLKAYRFDKYKTTEKAEKKPTLATLTIASDNLAAVKKAYDTVGAIVDGVLFARDLGMEPPNVMYPETAANTAAAQLRKVGVKVEILQGVAIKGFGCLLGVGQGSDKPPRVLVLQYYGAKNKKAAPVALVGKGVTFDTGGYSIKIPYSNMAGMKYDMMGAAGMIGTMYAIAASKAKVNVVAVCGFVENMISGGAFRPDDILTSLSGQTVEVLNTDAEGRLVLSDCMWYAQNRFKPAQMFTMATLTGGVIVALGKEIAGVMTNDDKSSNAILAAAKASGEALWRLPVGGIYDKLIDSHIADMRNIGISGGDAQTVVAATFLNRFVKKDQKWIHLDIAGVDMADSPHALGPKGAVGYGVRLLTEYITANH